MRTLLTAAAVTLFVTVAHSQTTRLVPSQYAHLQDAIVAAVPGDTVQLAANYTTNEDINFLGKAITVTGTDPRTSVIHGSGTTAVVTFQSNEGSGSILQNLTVENGGASGSSRSAPEGGAYIYQASPVLRGNLFRSNGCNAIAVVGGSPTITSNQMSGTLDLGTTLCLATEYAYGAGTFRYGGVALLLRGTGPANTLITGNTFSGNTQGTGAGAILSLAGSWIATNNVITGNAAGTGSALTAVTALGNFTFAQNLVYANTSNNTAFYHAAIDITDEGFPVTVGALRSFFTNNTVTANTAGTGFSYATDVYIGSSGGPTLSFVNNILSGGSLSFPALYCAPPVAQLVSDVLPAANNDIVNPSGGAASVGICAPVTGTYGNLSSDPLFNNPAAGDFHLRPGSPAIDAGNNSYTAYPGAAQAQPGVIYPQLTNDFDGKPRIENGTIDLGAYEVPSGTIIPSRTVTAYASTYDSTDGNLQLTALVAPPSVAAVTFFADGHALGSSSSNSSGIATFSPTLTPGAREITAAVSDPTLPATSVPFFVVVEKYAPKFTLTASANNVPQGQPVTYTLHITAPDTNQLSPLYLTDNFGATDLAQLTPDSTGTATYTTGALLQGTHNLGAYYAGDTLHTPARASLTETIVAPLPSTVVTTTTLTLAVNSAPLGASVGVTLSVSPATSAGHFTLSDNGVQALTLSPDATGVATGTISPLTIGAHTLLASFVPNDFAAFTPSTSAPALLTITAPSNVAATSTTLTVTPTTAYAGDPVALHVAVTPGAANGTISITDNGTALLTQPIAAGAPLDVSVSTFTVGTHLLVASYSPSDPTAFSPSTSAAVALLVTSQPMAGFTFSADSPVLTVATTHHLSTGLTLTSLHHFSGDITLTCGTLPPVLTCELPSAVNLPADGTVHLKLALDTDALLNFAAFLPLASLALVTRKRRRQVMLLVLAGLAATVTACSGHQPASTPPGTYTLTLTATSGSQQQTTNITLHVTQ
jgi:hypothetical protein